MYIFWRFTSDDGTFSAVGTGTGYDVDNLKRQTLGTQWGSNTSSGGASITVDLGSAQSIDAFALLGHNMVPGSDTASLSYASDSGFTTDTGTISTNLTSDNWYQYFGAISRQYWKLTLVKSASANQLLFGRMVLGTAYEPSAALRPGYSIDLGEDTSTSVRTRGGQDYSSIGTPLRVLRGTLPGLNDTDFDEIHTLENTYGTHTPFIASIDFLGAPTRKSLYGKLTRLTPFTNVARTYWEWNLSMKEQK